MPKERIPGKIAKTGGPITLEMIETDDVLAELGRNKAGRWVVGFALEAQNPRENALQKLRRKNCDWIVLNSPSAIGAESNQVEFLDQQGDTLQAWSGAKSEVASELVRWLDRQARRHEPKNAPGNFERDENRK
jgi:phosphopantothenoylcysteine decarboxylase/phosphopantothenate--cysteine ligase